MTHPVTPGGPLRAKWPVPRIEDRALKFLGGLGRPTELGAGGESSLFFMFQLRESGH